MQHCIHAICQVQVCTVHWTLLPSPVSVCQVCLFSDKLSDLSKIPEREL